jgi:hypothetical protein
MNAAVDGSPIYRALFLAQPARSSVFGRTHSRGDQSPRYVTMPHECGYRWQPDLSGVVSSAKNYAPRATTIFFWLQSFDRTVMTTLPFL